MSHVLAQFGYQVTDKMTLANSLKPTHPYDLHQFTSKGSVKGISGNVDMSAEPSEKFKELIFSA